MPPPAPQPPPAASPEEAGVRALYFDLLNAWNERSAANFAALFTPGGSSVGFDGSPLNGRAEIEASIGQIFADHLTAAYIGKIRAVQFLSPGVALLRAIGGMVPRGQADLNPAVNTIQSLVAVQQGERWQIALFQNTPAQFHGRPEMAQALTDELRELL